MVAAGPDPSAASQYPIHLSRNSNFQSVDASSKRARIRRLDDEVDVIALHGEVNDLEGGVLGRALGQ